MNIQKHKIGIGSTAAGAALYYLLETSNIAPGASTLVAPYLSTLLASTLYATCQSIPDISSQPPKAKFGFMTAVLSVASILSLTSPADIADTQTQTALDFAKEGKTIHTKVTVSRLPFGLSFDGFTVDMPVDSVVMRSKISPDIYKVGIYVDGLKEKEIDKTPEEYTVPEFPSSLPKHSEQSEKNAL